jgi:hypothetical protein
VHRLNGNAYQSFGGKEVAIYKDIGDAYCTGSRHAFMISVMFHNKIDFLE